MTRYKDASFGFSIWYPSTWKVTDEKVDDPTEPGWLVDATVLKRATIRNPAAANDNDLPPGVSFEELVAPNGLTELGAHSPSPVGVDQRYFFDSSTHQWMYQWLSESPDGTPPGQKPATISLSSMGGQPILFGAVRHGAELIVPLDPSHFLAISTLDPGGDFNHQFVAETVESTLPDSGKRPGPQVEEETICREAVKLRAIGEPLGSWYKDDRHIYDPNGDVVPGANPKTFVPFPPDGLVPSMFASDAVRVYQSRSGVIPGADPKTFVPTSELTARDARRTYDWSDGSLKIGELTENK